MENQLNTPMWGQSLPPEAKDALSEVDGKLLEILKLPLSGKAKKALIDLEGKVNLASSEDCSIDNRSFSKTSGLPLDDEKLVKEDLLERAAQKPVRDLKTYNVFFRPDCFDSVIRPNEHGLSIWGGRDYELRNTDIIRLQFPPDTDPLILLQALEDIADWIKQDIKAGWQDEVNESLPGPTPESIREKIRIESRKVNDDIPF